MKYEAHKQLVDAFVALVESDDPNAITVTHGFIAFFTGDRCPKLSNWLWRVWEDLRTAKTVTDVAPLGLQLWGDDEVANGALLTLSMLDATISEAQHTFILMLHRTLAAEALGRLLSQKERAKWN